MSDTSPLRRKIGAPRPDNVPPPLTPERLWRRAVSHGLTGAIGLEVNVDAVEIEPILPDQVAARIGDGALTAFLDGPLGYGVIVMSRGIAAAILEMLTLGRVQSRPLSEREITATDTSMLADPLDRILAAQETLVAEMGQPTIASGYRFATRIEAPREIVLTLEDATHDAFHVALTPGGTAAREGTILVVLPKLGAATAEHVPMEWSSRMEARVMGAEVPLRTELARLSMVVDDLRALKAGDRLTLGRHVIGNVRIVGPDGEQLGNGRLGQSCGRKALRLGEPTETFTAALPPRSMAVIKAGPPDGDT